MDTTIKKLILIVLATSLLLPVSAQIIGGEIFFEGNINPNWQNVFVYNVDNVNDYVEVLVSPDRFRYSFLNSRVGGGEIFSTGSTLRAEILNFENGFAAGPVNMILNQDLGDTLAYYYSGLNNGTTYYWEIVPYNGAGSTVGCDIYQFTTMSLPTGASCDYTVELIDAYGDGWNGGLLTISVGGIPVLTDITLSGGAGPEVFTLPIYDGLEITVSYLAGSWAYENEYHIYDVEGNEFYADGVGGVEPGIGGSAGFATCPSCDYTIELYDQYGDGWNGGLLDVLVDGIVVLDDLTLSGGAGPDIYTINVYDGSAITTAYTPGSWAYENSYTIIDPNGTVAFSDGDGGVEPLATGDAGISNCLAPAPGSGCGVALDYGFVNDPSITETLAADQEVWYMVTLDDEYANVNFSLCGSAIDTKLEIFDNCSATSYLAMNDDFCGTASEVEFAYLSAGVFYAKVYASAGVYGDYTLEVTADPAIFGCMAPDALNYLPTATVDEGCYFDGDSCSLAFDYGFINDPMVSSATLYAYDVVWYSFTAYQDYVDVMVSLCGSGFDTKLEVYDDCGNSYMYYNDDNYGTCGSSSSHIDIPTLAAGTYYVKVYGYSSNYGNFDLEITGDFAAFQGCYYSLELSDEYGDGWNGGYLDIKVNGNTLDDDLTTSVAAWADDNQSPEKDGFIVNEEYTNVIANLNWRTIN